MNLTERKPRMVLITNDDGPPSELSPFIWSFVSALEAQLGWTTRVVIPSVKTAW